MKNNNKKTLKKLAILVIGSIIAAYGITLALYAGFGGATLAVLWQGIARTFHISIGTASFVVALGMILFALIFSAPLIQCSNFCSLNHILINLLSAVRTTPDNSLSFSALQCV